MTVRSGALVGAVLVAGAMSMGLEILGSRLLAPDFGQSLYTWGALISVVLVALALGYSAGGVASRRFGGFRALSTLLVVGGAWVAALPFVAGAVTEGAAALGVKTGALCASAALFIVPVAAFAAVGPICIRMQVRDPREAGLWAGLLSALSTVGSVAGTLGTSFFLIERWSVRGSLLVGGILTLAAGMGVLWVPPGANPRGDVAPLAHGRGDDGVNG